MALVTLRTGRVVNLSRDNVDSALTEQIDAYRAQGVADSNFFAAQQEAFYKLAGVSYDTTAREESQALAQKVIDNPLATASRAVTEALPDSARSILGDTSNAVFDAGAAASKGVRGFAADAWDNVKAAASHLPHIVDEANTTARILAISGAVVVVGGVTVYLVFKFKR